MEIVTHHGRGAGVVCAEAMNLIAAKVGHYSRGILYGQSDTSIHNIPIDS